MKQQWSAEWKSSIQPRKQRKYRHNAPLHVRHKFLGARLSSEYVRQFGRKSLPVRKGDEVRMMRGSSKGLKGIVDRVDLKKSKIYVEGIIVKKVDGSEVMKALEPSNTLITKPSMDDKKRQVILERTQERAKQLRAQKPAEKPKHVKASEKKNQDDKAEETKTESKTNTKTKTEKNEDTKEKGKEESRVGSKEKK